jgi:hypothetical protein
MIMGDDDSCINYEGSVRDLGLQERCDPRAPTPLPADQI